jgi:hypothetical protein
MAYQLTFDIKHRFKTTDSGITIPVSLAADGYNVVCDAKVDMGAERCLFQRELADHLNLELESGVFARFGTLAGTVPAYGHRITIETLGIAYESLIFFHIAYGMPRNLLGIGGWMEHLHLAVTMDDGTIYLKSIY